MFTEIAAAKQTARQSNVTATASNRGECGVMRRRRGGGGFGRGGGRRRDDFGVQREGPVIEEPSPYPENPLLSKTKLHLTEEEKCLVALNRIMVNYWKFQSPFHVEERSTKGEGMQTYSDMLQRRAILDWNEQKAAIVEHTSPFFFPQELLENKYTPPGSIGTRSTIQKIIKNRLSVTQKSAATEDEQQGDNQENAEELEELQDFGGDDYAVDYYAENDSDDGNDGRDDETF